MHRTVMMTRGGKRLLGMAAILVMMVTAVPAMAQDRDPSELLEDFVHYTSVARPDLASAWGQQLLDSGVTDAELAIIVEETRGGVKRFDEAVKRALLVEDLEDIAAEVARRVEAGRLDLARDGERIDDAIQMLVGTQRQKLLASGRLRAAGEYAVPALLTVITDGRDDRMKLASQNMLETIGLQAVAPLSLALPSLHPDSQVIVCDILGGIGYPHAAPALKEVATDPATPEVVARAAERAYAKIEGSNETLDMLFASLAEQYFNVAGALVPFPGEATNNVWSYDEFVGLKPTPVPTEIFPEVMAMRTAARALEENPTNRKAIAVYVASNLKRENDLPDGLDDLVYGESDYTPEFYATVFGTEICLDVLARAIDRGDTILVRDAIAALSETTGGSNLFAGGTLRQPLLEALAYPDRRVQYDAALALARALPASGFEGDFRVVPTLASAVQAANQSFVIVVSDDDENRRQVTKDLEELAFTIAGAEAHAASVGNAVAETSGIDLAVVRMRTRESAEQTVNNLRSMPKMSAAPILILASLADQPQLKFLFRDDPFVKVARPGLALQELEANIDELLMKAMGGRMTEAESQAYAFEALSALEDVAIACSPAYRIADAEGALLEALELREGRARLLVAAILARIDSRTAQQELFDAALAASGGERVDLLDHVAASVRRFGNYAEPRHVNALLDLILDSSGSTAEAAARVHGAMNLPGPDAINLITGDRS